MSGRRTSTIAAIGISGFLLVATGCGKVADKVTQKATEKATEKVIEHETGGNVDLDSKGGKVKVKTDDGEVTFGDDGATIKSKDGNATYGTNAKVPKDWPDDIEIPDGLKLTLSTSGANGLSLAGNLPKGNAKTVFQSIMSSLEDNGYELGGKTEISASDGFTGSVTGTKSNRSVNVMVNASNGVYVMMTVEPKN